MDRDLVEAAQQGDREAFASLARARGDRLFALAQRILRDIDRAEDAVQQTLVIAWRELPRLRDPDRFDPWITRLLVNASYAEAKRARRHASHIRQLPVDVPVPTDDTGLVAVRDQLERGFRRLAPEHRAVLVLRHYLGFEPAEIADTLGIPLGTARSRLHYAHRSMRAALEADLRPSVVGEQLS